MAEDIFGKMSYFPLFRCHPVLTNINQQWQYRQGLAQREESYIADAKKERLLLEKTSRKFTVLKFFVYCIYVRSPYIPVNSKPMDTSLAHVYDVVCGHFDNCVIQIWCEPTISLLNSVISQ
ncbi:hypothetical protein GDO81_011490 [Engystomops pustulosus]|uniref:Uncharacterized protein n=1 Tax=Engystomops pustulosus TaxID=76066 RepID=A0AAV7BF05_ENGPU|nr:hypothetical protein GDO81_011490 [Engystomops pustulosus]